jgi:hypothetical protein
VAFGCGPARGASDMSPHVMLAATLAIGAAVPAFAAPDEDLLGKKQGYPSCKLDGKDFRAAGLRRLADEPLPGRLSGAGRERKAPKRGRSSAPQRPPAARCVPRGAPQHGIARHERRQRPRRALPVRPEAGAPLQLDVDGEDRRRACWSESRCPNRRSKSIDDRADSTFPG